MNGSTGLLQFLESCIQDILGAEGKLIVFLGVENDKKSSEQIVPKTCRYLQSKLDQEKAQDILYNIIVRNKLWDQGFHSTIFQVE